MTEKHATPEWRKTVRIIRAQVRKAWDRNDDVVCWRHGDIIEPGMPFDVGHLDTHGGESVGNAAPECRRGNRSHGGRMGAAITNGRRAARAGRPTFKPLPWA